MAQIKFTQGATTDLIGRAVIGATGTAVVCSSDGGTYDWTLSDAPPTSALSTPSTIGTGSTTASFTPDVAGTYHVELYLAGVLLDARDFIVLVNGYQIPAFNSTKESFNPAGELKGWIDVTRLLHDLANGGGSSYKPPIDLTYADPVVTDASLGDYFIFAIGDANPYGVANPTNPTYGQRITYLIANESGGASGGAVWGSAFRLADPGFVEPADNKATTISFVYADNGTDRWWQDGAQSGDMTWIA